MGKGLRDVEAWLLTNDLEMELSAVWVLAIGFAVWSAVKIVSWRTLRHQHDRTDVGRNLKWQKLGEAIATAAMSMLYSLTLYAYYTEHQWGVWERLVVRSIVACGIVAAAVYGLRFARALRRETRIEDER